MERLLPFGQWVYDKSRDSCDSSDSCSKKNPSAFYPCAKWYPFKFRGWIIQWSGRKNLCSSVRSVGDKNNHPWGKKWFIRGEGYYRPPLSPPKNPIKREKKKLVYSSEREDFIWRGEDRFVRFLRVLVCSLSVSWMSSWGSANCIFIQLCYEYPMHKNGRWIWFLLYVEASRNRCSINFK